MTARYHERAEPIVFSSSLLQVPFLNLMANMAQRSGSVHIRVGGNTQETATLVDSLPNGKILTKMITNTSNPVCVFPPHFSLVNN